MGRRTRTELEAENLVLYRELETIRDRIDEFLGNSEPGAPGHGVDGLGDTSDFLPELEGALRTDGGGDSDRYRG